MPKKTVFIVDDDPAVRDGLKFLLRTVGYGVEAFPSAQSFLHAYNPGCGGCLLLDVQMPSMTGLALQKELNLRGWEIPVIFITALGTSPLAIEAIEAGAFGLIEKPLNADVLLGCIERALDAEEGAHSGTASAS